MELSAPDALLGKQVGCPRCNQQFTIGNGAAGNPSAAAPAAEGLGSGPTARFKAPPANSNPPDGAGRETISMTGGAKPVPPPPPAGAAQDKRPAAPGAQPPPASPPTPGAIAGKSQPGRETVPMGGAPPAGPDSATPSQSSSSATGSPPPASRPEARRPAPKQAKFISGDSSQSRINLGGDGQLPELKLEEGKSSGRNREQREGANSLVLILVFGFSLGMSILMLWMPGGSSGPNETTKSEALVDLQNHYINDQPPPLEPYQRLLREAKQARSRGDYKTERARYRRVLDMLHAEGKNKFKGLTGVPSGTVPPNDEHLERTLSTLLAE